jgi:hypothetical protein
MTVSEMIMLPVNSMHRLIIRFIYCLTYTGSHPSLGGRCATRNERTVNMWGELKHTEIEILLYVYVTESVMLAAAYRGFFCVHESS